MAESCLLYYITDRSAFPGDESVHRTKLLEKISEAVRAGVDYIQLREKDLSARDLESLSSDALSIITRLRTANRELRTALLINSRTDIAMAVGADGVHLRSEDVTPADIRAIWKQCGAGALARELPRQTPLIGVSSHSPQEVGRAAENHADFAVFAPVFEKKDAQKAGLDSLCQACKENIPVLALGGVRLENAKACLDAGAAGIAGIRLFQENNIAEVVKQLRG